MIFTPSTRYNLDQSYEFFGADAATVNIDLKDLTFAPTSTYSFITDISGCTGPNGFSIVNGTDQFDLIWAAANAINLDADLGIANIACSKGIYLDALAGIDITADTASQFVVSGATEDLTFGARGQTITLNENGQESLDAVYTATSIIGALNELVSVVGLSTDLDEAYNNFGVNPSYITVDSAVADVWGNNGIGWYVNNDTSYYVYLASDSAGTDAKFYIYSEDGVGTSNYWRISGANGVASLTTALAAYTATINGGDATWNIVNDNSFVVDLSGVTTIPNGSQDGFKVLNGSDYFKVYWGGANTAVLDAYLSTGNIDCSSTFTLDASAISIDATGASNVSVTGANLTLSTITTGSVLLSASVAGNYGIGTSSFATSELGFIAMASGTKPTGGWPGDVAHLGVYDRGGTAGKAAWHFYCEDGTPSVIGDRFGFGTATPEGFFNLHGANASATGPTFQITTAADAYPLFQVFAYQHDHINLCFDCYYSTAGSWISSDAGSNYKILKDSDALKFQYDSGIAQGAAITWNTGFALDTAGQTKFYGTVYGYLTTDLVYPTYQYLFFDHDNIAMTFDGYYDGSWKSSDAGSNFQLYKTTDSFKIQYDSGVAQGGAVTWNAGIVLDASGKVGIGVSPLTNMASGDMVLEGGSLVLKEITTPTADADYGKVYTKNDNKLYFQDGAGAEHEIALAT